MVWTCGNSGEVVDFWIHVDTKLTKSTEASHNLSERNQGDSLSKWKDGAVFY